MSRGRGARRKKRKTKRRKRQAAIRKRVNEVVRRLQGDLPGLDDFWDYQTRDWKPIPSVDPKTGEECVAGFVFETRMMCDNPAAGAILTDISKDDD